MISGDSLTIYDNVSAVIFDYFSEGFDPELQEIFNELRELTGSTFPSTYIEQNNLRKILQHAEEFAGMISACILYVNWPYENLSKDQMDTKLRRLKKGVCAILRTSPDRVQVQASLCGPITIQEVCND